MTNAHQQIKEALEYYANVDTLEWAHDIYMEHSEDNESPARQALHLLESHTVVSNGAFSNQCEDEMSRANHKKKIAEMDYHTSEENHQSGRWHCAHDLEEFSKAMIKKARGE